MFGVFKIILSGKEIKQKLGKEIVIRPFNDKQLNPNSYNLNLHDEIMTYNDNILDMKKNNSTSKIKIPPEGIVLKPGKIYLARTVEYTETKNYVPFIEGRSSIGRLGVFIHSSSPYGNVGFKGYWTLEISCIQPVRIYPFISICQIYYQSVEGDYDSYDSVKYQNNKDIIPSLMYKEFKNN